MRAVIFFMYLCFLLLKGYDYTYTGIHHRMAAVQHNEKAIKPVADAPEEECLFDEEVEEDDEEDHTAVEKCHVQYRYIALSTHTFILRYLYDCRNGRLRHKYITLRALRI